MIFARASKAYRTHSGIASTGGTKKEGVMTYFTSPLDHVRVAAPCPANWDDMFGDERVRFCAQCQLNVYNLSEMLKAEAELLIGRNEGRLCVRYYQRRDGSIITQNCPVGLRAIKQRVSRIATALVSIIFTFLAGVGAHSLARRLYLIGNQPMMGDSYTLTGVLAEEEVLPVVVGDFRVPDEGIITGQLVPITRKKIPRQRVPKK